MLWKAGRGKEEREQKDVTLEYKSPGKEILLKAEKRKMNIKHLA